MKRAVFLDRDGTLNVDPGYLDHPDRLSLIPGAAKAVDLLKRAGFSLIVVSNQSGVGRGLIKAEMIPRINQRLNDLLRPSGAEIDRFEMCFRMPEDPASRRKPKPDLILDAARAEGVDVSLSYMVGDKASDVRAGRAAGCAGTALVRTGLGTVEEKDLAPGEADFIGADLLEVSQWILARSASS